MNDDFYNNNSENAENAVEIRKQHQISGMKLLRKFNEEYDFCNELGFPVTFKGKKIVENCFNFSSV